MLKFKLRLKTLKAIPVKGTRSIPRPGPSQILQLVIILNCAAGPILKSRFVKRESFVYLVSVKEILAAIFPNPAILSITD